MVRPILKNGSTTGCTNGKNLLEQVPLTPAYKPHSQISRTPSLATEILGKNFWKEIKVNQKWSLKNDVFHVHALMFLQVSCMHQPAY